MKKVLIGIAVGLIVIVSGSLAVWRIADSENYQTFGRLVPRVDTSQKLVALTFDDGPTPAGTDRILSILDEHQVRATFFVIGSELEKNIDSGQKIVAAGHQLGNHSFSHRRMLFVTRSFVEHEVEKTDELIREAGYQNEIYFRPPYGKKLFMLPYYLSNTGRTTVTWDVAPESNSMRNGNAERIAESALTGTRPGSIIVLHVMYSSGTESVKAVAPIIEGLKTQGYTFVTVSELLAAS